MELNHVKGTTALRLKKAGLDTHIATRFVNHPLQQALFVAREEALQQLQVRAEPLHALVSVCGLVAQTATGYIGRNRAGSGNEANLSGFQARWRHSRVYYRSFPP
jgi:hypothetical protein